jgi:tetraacyldisaccharide 4'-kinase
VRALLLFPLTVIYYIINIIWDFYWRSKEPVKVNSRVISIGNITIGGSGKTPIAGFIANSLISRGKKVALVARGYGRLDKTPIVVNSDEEIDWRKCGDEPAVLARKVKGLTIYVDSDKTSAANKAANDGFEYIIIDDGFQHRKLNRDLDIVCLDGNNPFGNGLLLPSGRLREPRRALKRADAIILVDSQPKSATIKLKKAVTILNANKIFEGIKSLNGGSIDLTGKKVIGFCGLGNPESFRNSLVKCGCLLSGFMTFRDHHIYDEEDIFRISKQVCVEQAAGAVTTMKDFVKLEKLWPADIALYYIDIAIELDNENELYRLIGL